MANARDIVDQYFTAFYAGDGQTARQYLADDVSFRGPAATFSTADNYLRAAAHAVRAAKGVQKHKVFVDGPDVCIWYDLHIDHAVGSIAMADWYHVVDGKISSIQTILDTAPFATVRRQQSDDTAVDLVCRMTVQKASAAATRTFAGTTYYFCNPGCAEAFERQPEAYAGVAA
jgi:YHS domain-containing protein/ketosteroid isomerase-like protein